MSPDMLFDCFLAENEVQCCPCCLRVVSPFHEQLTLRIDIEESRGTIVIRKHVCQA